MEQQEVVSKLETFLANLHANTASVEDCLAAIRLCFTYYDDKKLGRLARDVMRQMDEITDGGLTLKAQKVASVS